MKTKRVITSLFVSVALLSAGQTMAVEQNVISMMSVKQRLERMERLLSPEVLLRQQQQMQAMRSEITTLLEQIDQQGYELDSIKQRQRSLYLDIDRRLSSLEKGSSASSNGSAGSTAPRSDAVPPPPMISHPGVSGGVSLATSSNATAKTTGSNDPDGKAAYDEAFSLLKEGQYKQTIPLFDAFIKKYPQSKYSDNAQYWLGEAYYAYRQYPEALNGFQKLIAHYPESSKVSGARLKMGYVYYELQNWSAARENLMQVVKLYPGTPMSKKAQERIDRMKREGH